MRIINEPRLLTRTHYQVDEPAYLRILVLKCTSATQSDYRERVANRLLMEVKKVCSFNLAAANYAVDLGRATGLINENNVWTDKAHLLNLVHEGNEGAELSLQLSLRERIVFFHLLLQTDGAAIVYFLKELKVRGRLPEGDFQWNAIANDLFTWTLTTYYARASDLANRTRLRHLNDKRRVRPFAGRSGEHQCLIHLQSMYRLGLIGKADRESTRSYTWSVSGSRSVAEYLARYLSSIEELETSLKDQRWVDYASHIYSSRTSVMCSEAEVDHRFYSDVSDTYRKIIATGIPLCPLATLIEGVQIEQIASGEKVRPQEECLQALRRLQRHHPGKVHFHVDRLGRPAYLKLDTGLDVSVVQAPRRTRDRY